MSNRKHLVLVNKSYISVKDWYRLNSNQFVHIKGIPTSEQIGRVLKKDGFRRSNSLTEVIYSLLS